MPAKKPTPLKRQAPKLADMGAVMLTDKDFPPDFKATLAHERDNDRTTRLIMSACIFGALRANSRASAEMVSEAILSAQEIIDADTAMRMEGMKK